MINSILKKYDRLKKINLLKELKKSANSALHLILWSSAIASLCGYTIRCINNQWSWWQCLLVLLVALIILTVLFLIKNCFTEVVCYKTEINGKTVTIKKGDIFKEDGWKIIPFNERFDTKVDDKIIAHTTLNGIMIDSYVSDLSDLNRTIKDAQKDNSLYKPMFKNEKAVYPLGRIIAYKDFLMLAFTHFDSQERAYIKVDEYEQLLFRMWVELRRVYMGKPIAIPLIGTGVTDIEGLSVKNYTELLKCILCTFQRSSFQPVKGITIVLTEEAINKIDFTIIKDSF